MTFEQFVQLVEILKWPVVALVVFFVLRSTVAALLERTKKAGFGNKSVEFSEPVGQASEQQRAQLPQQPQGTLAPTNELPPPPASPAIAEVENALRATVDGSNASEEVKRSWLIRALAIARMERAHEATYRLIMGSQINLLLKANTGTPVSLPAARALYDEAVAGSPEIYAHFDFDNWLKWPANTGLIRVEDGATKSVMITEIGKEFLHFLVSSGLTLPKPG